MYGLGQSYYASAPDYGGSSNPYGIPPGLWAAMQTWTAEERARFIAAWLEQTRNVTAPPPESIGPPESAYYANRGTGRTRYYYAGVPVPLPPAATQPSNQVVTSPILAEAMSANGETPAELGAGDFGSWLVPLGALAAVYFFFLRK